MTGHADAWRTFLIGALLAAVCVGGAAAADTPGLGFGIAAGYDGNPAQRRDGPALWFARYGLDAVQPLDGPPGDLELQAALDYRDYEGANDNWRGSLGLDWRTPLERRLGTLGLVLRLARYRDRLVPADERDEAALRLSYDRLLGARYELGLWAEGRRLDYRNAALPWAGRPGSGPGPGARGQGGGHRPGAMARDDTGLALGLEVRGFWSRSLSSSVSARLERRDSTVSVEAYDQAGVGLELQLSLPGRWWLEAGAAGSLTEYDRAPRGLRRDDETLTLFAALGRPWGPGEVHCDLQRQDNESSVEIRSYRQVLVQCGYDLRF